MGRGWVSVSAGDGRKRLSLLLQACVGIGGWRIGWVWVLGQGTGMGSVEAGDGRKRGGFRVDGFDCVDEGDRAGGGGLNLSSGVGNPSSAGGVLVLKGLASPIIYIYTANAYSRKFGRMVFTKLFGDELLQV
ncbi:hypothetical protein Pyn_28089 [Prunus yedoensis var. nudiflora]|uniref:Uncharacterized protein n=1 Tax=Prunus yedoensis var. nudiflora TaxID=2094558 RepID=A0A314XRR4_PRUYE|nr:hypothetical protein Pyn_28089 [Prunus yedoensis var. nudiflora]